MAAKYRNNGQVCISPSRFYIHKSKKKQFTESFVNKTLKLKIGNGMDKGVQLGPITTKKRLDEIEKLVEITKKEGAKVLCGGKRPSGFNKGYFYEPTIFDNVKDDFKIMSEEPFGPLTPLLTFENFDEVVKLPHNAICLASNRVNKIQSLYFEINKTRIWGLQYHPEISYEKMINLIEFRKERLIKVRKAFKDESELKKHISIIKDEITISDKEQRMLELKNWINIIDN